MRDQVLIPGELGAGRDRVFHLMGRWAEEPIPPASYGNILDLVTASPRSHKQGVSVNLLPDVF